MGLKIVPRESLQLNIVTSIVKAWEQQKYNYKVAHKFWFRSFYSCNCLDQGSCCREATKHCWLASTESLIAGATWDLLQDRLVPCLEARLLWVTLVNSIEGILLGLAEALDKRINFVRGSSVPCESIRERAYLSPAVKTSKRESVL